MSVVCVIANVEITIRVDVDFVDGGGSSFTADVSQAVQDAIGHTGAVVAHLTDWELADDRQT